MLAVADTALDFFVLELVLHSLSVGVLALVFGLLLPVDRGAEDDVLADGGGIGGWARGVLSRGAELRPCLALRHQRAHHLAMGDVPDAPRRFDLLAVLIVAVLNDGRAAVFVLDLLGRRQVVGRLLNVLVIRPVVPVW